MRPTLFASVASVAFALSTAAFAMGGGANGVDKPPAAAANPDYTRAKTMIEAKNYKAALPILQQVVAKDPKNADAFTLLGYATRKSGDPNGSLQYYNTALSLDPKHIGAHEYIGEAYLMLDRPQEADKELVQLNKLCVFGCTEYTTLKAAIANYKAGNKPTN
jgi:predicted Zn-dependent protease